MAQIQIQIPIPKKYFGFGYKGIVFYRNNGCLLKNMDKRVSVTKWVLINRPKIPQMPQKLSAQIVCPSWLNLKIQLLLMQPWMIAMANSVVWNFKWDFKIILAPFSLSVLHEGRKRSKNYIFSQTRKGRKFYQIRPQGRNILLILFQKEITQWGEIISDGAFLFFKLGAPLQGKQSSF